MALLGSWAFRNAFGYFGLESDKGRRASTGDYSSTGQLEEHKSLPTCNKDDEEILQGAIETNWTMSGGHHQYAPEVEEGKCGRLERVVEKGKEERN